jgi:hypothetical protein
VRPLPSQVGQNVGVVAARIFEGVSKNRQPIEGLLVINVCGDRKNGWTTPSSLDGKRAKGIAEYFPENRTLSPKQFTAVRPGNAIFEGG